MLQNNHARNTFSIFGGEERNRVPIQLHYARVVHRYPGSAAVYKQQLLKKKTSLLRLCCGQLLEILLFEKKNACVCIFMRDQPLEK